MLLEFITYTLVSFSGLNAETKLITPLPKASFIPSPLPTNTPPPTPTATPTPKPTATPTPTPIPITAPNDINSFFDTYATTYNTDVNLLKHIAKCESGFNPEAENGPYQGMFQFTESTWIFVRTRMGENTDPVMRKNAQEAIKTAAFAIGHGGQNAWAGCL